MKGIDFDAARWNRVKDTYRRWWDGELTRPIVPLMLSGRDPGRTRPEAPILSQATCTDLSLSAEALIDRLDYELSTLVFLGDAYPLVTLDCFGPGVLAAFLGATVDNHTGSVWFHPREALAIEDVHFSYDPDNVWLNRIKEIAAAAMRRWQGQVLVSMTDLGGIMDVISTFLPGVQLLTDLYDNPAEVTRLVWEAHDLWHRYFEEINQVLQPINPGYSSWCRIYSDVPYYMLQCDFSYMISPEMFQEFVLPELAASTTRLPRSFYHLDGKGQLPHLDALLTLAELDGVQWVPGAGMPTCEYWPDVIAQIFAAGKKTQLNWLSDNPTLIRNLQATSGIGPGSYYVVPLQETIDDLPQAQRLLSSLGIEN